MNEKGAASVLIILVMVVLVTLGAFAITSANANYKFSQRAVAWNTEYYSLDAEGEAFLAAVDKQLGDAGERAVDYMQNGYYQNQTPPEDFPVEWQAAIYQLVTKMSSNSYDLQLVFNYVFMYYVDSKLNDFQAVYPGCQVYSLRNDLFIADIWISTDITNEAGNTLSVGLWVNPLAYTATLSGGDVSVTPAPGQFRYIIEDWYEHQEAADFEIPEQSLWDGSIK